MLSIGDFARFAGVSVRTLRHHDALGLLTPSYVDPVTGYRHYAPDLLARADALVALKELGFTLEQVGALLDQRLSEADLRRMLDQRRDELRDQIDADSARLAEVERRLRLMEEGTSTMTSLEYVEMPLPSVALHQLTGRVDDVSEVGPQVGPLFDRVAAVLAGAGLTIAGPAVAWYDADGDGLRFGTGFPAEVDSPDGVEHAVLPEAPRAVTAVYRGSMEGIGEAWQSLARHVAAAGLEFAGACREVYLATPEDDPDGWVTELQQPVR